MTHNKNTPSTYFSTYPGRDLLENHSLEEIGTWRIFGEDTNCDLGGHHHEPELAFVEGKLEDIVAYAVSLPNFYSWGGGGRIAKVSSPQKITSETVVRKMELERKAAELRAQLSQIERQLKE